MFVLYATYSRIRIPGQLDKYSWLFCNVRIQSIERNLRSPRVQIHLWPLVSPPSQILGPTAFSNWFACRSIFTDQNLNSLLVDDLWQKWEEGLSHFCLVLRPLLAGKNFNYWSHYFIYLFVCLFVCLPEVGDLLLASRAGLFWKERVFAKWMVSPPSWILTETEDEARVQQASCTTKRRDKRIHHLAITCPALKRLDIKCLLFKLIFFRFRLISFRFFFLFFLSVAVG